MFLSFVFDTFSATGEIVPDKGWEGNEDDERRRRKEKKKGVQEWAWMIFVHSGFIHS
jgi:hypothetical protein